MQIQPSVSILFTMQEHHAQGLEWFKHSWTMDQTTDF